MSEPPEPPGDFHKRMETLIRRVKNGLRYQGSIKTGDILQDLVRKWMRSEDAANYATKPTAWLRQSIKHFIIDVIRKRDRHGGVPDDIEEVGVLEQLALFSEDSLLELLDIAALCVWMDPEIRHLESGKMDRRVNLPVFGRDPKKWRIRQVGRALRMEAEGHSQAEIAEDLGISETTAGTRLQEGRTYLVPRHRGFDRLKRRQVLGGNQQLD